MARTASVPRQSAQARFEEIDVLRGLAALWVVLSHYSPYWVKNYGPALVLVPNAWGVYAVYLFFTISGFVIFLTLEKCESLADFAVLRFSRLYPTFWATLLIATSIGIVAFDATLWPGGLLVNATMFEDFIGYPRIDIVYWSLTVELAFYIIVGCLLMLRLHTYPLAFVNVWLILSCAWSLNTPERDAMQRDGLALFLALDFAPFFAIGILLYHATRRQWSTTVKATLALALVSAFLSLGLAGLSVAAISALLLAMAVKGRLNCLKTKATIWLGSISYALYLIHRNLGYQFLTWMHERNIGPELAIPVAVILALLLASAVTRWIERPCILRIRQWYGAWKARRVESSS